MILRINGQGSNSTIIRKSWPACVFPLLDRKKPLNWLELGSYEGRSALWTIRNMFLNPDSKITCIDTWETHLGNPNSEATFDSNTSGIPQIIKRKGPTKEVLPTLPPKNFHGCYITVSHGKNDVLTDARLVLPLMLPGAVIVFDDYGWSKGSRVREAVNLLRKKWSHVAQLKYLKYQAVFQVNPEDAQLYYPAGRNVRVASPKNGKISS